MVQRYLNTSSPISPTPNPQQNTPTKSVSIATAPVPCAKPNVNDLATYLGLRFGIDRRVEIRRGV